MFLAENGIDFMGKVRKPYEENEFLGSFDNKSCYLFYNKKLDVQLSNKFTDKEVSDINDFLKKI